MKPEERLIFPDPLSADNDGLLCVGGNLSVETLLESYSHGIFPWPQEGLPLLWFSPVQRGVLDFSEIHWSKRFLREIRQAKFKVTFNRDFASVIAECARIPRAHERGTWILPAMQEAYLGFHRAGYAHSVECWSEDGEVLIGGLYGVFVAGVFSGESMFFRQNNASKYCLYALLNCLQESGLTWMDIQMVTPVLESLGGKYISRLEFQERLREASRRNLRLKFQIPSAQ